MERDAMNCRSCGNEERASEGYPCLGCETFICQICAMRGIQHCRRCVEQGVAPAQAQQSQSRDG